MARRLDGQDDGGFIFGDRSGAFDGSPGVHASRRTTGVAEIGRCGSNSARAGLGAAWRWLLHAPRFRVRRCGVHGPDGDFDVHPVTLRPNSLSNLPQTVLQKVSHRVHAWLRVR